MFWVSVPGGGGLTGGSSQVAGVRELAGAIFERPVRLGFPHGVQGLKDVVKIPACSTATGFLIYSIQELLSFRVYGRVSRHFLGRISGWFLEKF